MNDRELYLDYVNNFISVTGFASHHGLTDEQANQVIQSGRCEHELSVAGIRVSNTSGNGSYPSAVRVYLHNRLIAEVTLTPRNPLGYLRDRKKSKHLDSLREQCLDGGLTLEQFNMIVRK